ncbi:recombinase family protein [Rhodococcus aetherivorans]
MTTPSGGAFTTRQRRRRSRIAAPEGTVVAYLRVSTSEQAASGLGLDAQRATIADYAARKGLTVVAEYVDEGISAKSLKGRPGALAALAAVRSGQAAGLMVAKMDRLSRSVVDGARVMDQARTEGWALHFADLDIDTSTPAGEMAANVIISGSQYERRLISSRTKDALAAKRARGERLGAEPALPREVTRRIVAERAEGRTFQAIADGLMSDGIPTARGKATWYPATVKAVVVSDNAAELRSELELSTERRP